ncbi:MAG: hypothetical protein ISS33_05940 [Candidatus Omnitrophica bacterium]|nr:hypothetical protein [Candidatus Omnitrophota bacterium]
MSNEANEILKRYGLKGLVCAMACVICATLILWGIAHNIGESGKPVVVLWGLVEYTKQIAENKLDKTTSATTLTPEEKFSPKAKKMDATTEIKDPPTYEILEVKSSKRMYVSQSLEKISAAIKGTNDLQIKERFKRLYKGKWLRVRGPCSVTTIGGKEYIMFETDRKFVWAIQYEMNESEKEKIYHLPEKTIITVDGRFDYIMPGIKIMMSNGIIVENL